MECMTRSQELISLSSVLSKSVRRRTDRARLPPIATFSHKLLENRSFNRKLTTHGNPHHLKHLGSRNSQFFCDHSDCSYAQKKIPFKFKCRLDRHMLSHQNPGRLKCSHCDILFNTKEALERHALIHRGIKPYTCEICSKSFARTSERSRCRKHHQLVSHLKDSFVSTQNEPLSALAKEVAINQSKPRPYRCPVCADGKSFTDRGSLRRHKRRHHQGPLGLELPEKPQDVGQFSDQISKSHKPHHSHPSDANDIQPHSMPDLCIILDQAHFDPSSIEPSSFPNNFLLSNSPEPDVTPWPAPPFDASFSEQEIGPSGLTESFSDFSTESHLGFNLPTSPVNLCNTASYRDVLEHPHLGIMHNPNVGSASNPRSSSESPNRNHMDFWSGCRIPNAPYFTVAQSSDDAIDLSGQSGLGMSNPIDLSFSQPTCDPVPCEFDYSLVGDDQSAGVGAGRSLFPLTWDPDPGFSFTDLLTSPELEGLPVPVQISPVNYSPATLWCSAQPPLDLRLIHPPYI